MKKNVSELNAWNRQYKQTHGENPSFAETYWNPDPKLRKLETQAIKYNGIHKDYLAQIGFKFLQMEL